MTNTRKTLQDCQGDAVILHGIAQGMEELDNIAGDRPCPASNAMTCLSMILTERLNLLANDLDRLEKESRR